jgi:hypothetical protein
MSGTSKRITRVVETRRTSRSRYEKSFIRTDNMIGICRLSNVKTLYVGRGVILIL